MATCFTIDRDGTLAAGMVLKLTRHTDVEPTYLQPHVDELLPDGVSSHGDRYLLNPALATLVSPNVELIWEYVRRAVAPAAPSRFESWFGWETQEEAERFASGYGAGSIWAVEAAETFRADMRWLTLQGSILVASHSASCYWRQEPFSRYWPVDGSPMWELLLRPPVVVRDLVAPAPASDQPS